MAQRLCHSEMNVTSTAVFLQHRESANDRSTMLCDERLSVSNTQTSNNKKNDRNCTCANKCSYNVYNAAASKSLMCWLNTACAGLSNHRFLRRASDIRGVKFPSSWHERFCRFDRCLQKMPLCLCVPSTTDGLFCRVKVFILKASPCQHPWVKSLFYYT